MLLLASALVICAAVAHALARDWSMVASDSTILASSAFFYLVLRYPRRLVYRLAAFLLAACYVLVTIAAYHRSIGTPSLIWSSIGALSSIALLGSVTSAMLLGHWYLVVRGMSIEPLKRLAVATLICSIAKLLVVAATLAILARAGTEPGSGLYRVAVGQGIFFWMRVGWGLVGPLILYPMIWGTVRIRSTMAATGILYVAVVAVVIGEVLGTYLSSVEHLPL